jgi:mannose-6-phosphate isomerase-like protein (cupin superfamily)
MTVEYLRDHLGASEGRHFKDTLFRSDRLLLGVNCLEPGQSQEVHVHAGQDKAYIVEEGTGVFTVASEHREVGRGGVVWAPAGVPHGVMNAGSERLVLVVAIAPAPGQPAGPPRE